MLRVSKLASGQLEVLALENTYIEGGSFATKKMYDLLEQTLLSARRAGFKSVSACGDMVWALKNLTGTDELLGYKSSLNLLTPHNAVSLIYMYDVKHFIESAITDVLLTHPYVIKDGKISIDQYYVEPLMLMSNVSSFRSRPLNV
ncbi:MEDS domain-containing protein [Pedobacter sp. AW1-32]|uniref:MEDS domain-containing protein n=1 Tax=Pedobacter sp. AW1-32 TaxID=3383026 RepID=UPI003FEE1654